MEYPYQKPNHLDTLEKTNASENSNNGEYGKLKYKYGIRNTPQKPESSTSTEMVNFSSSYELNYICNIIFLLNTYNRCLLSTQTYILFLNYDNILYTLHT